MARRLRSHERYGTPPRRRTGRRRSREPVRIREVLLGAGEVLPEGILGRRQLPGGEEALHEREAPLAHLRQGGVGHPHRPAPYASAVQVSPGRRAVRSRRARRRLRHGGPRIPRLALRTPRARAPRTVVGTDRRDGRRHLRQRPPPLRAQHRAVAHPGLHRHLPLRARARDGGARRRGRPRVLRGGRDPGGDRPLHPVPAPGDRPAVRQLCPRLDVVVPQPRQPGPELGTLARLHPGPRWRVGRLGARARVHAPPAARRDRRPGRQPLRAGLHRLSRPHAGDAQRRRPRAGRGRRHHRSGRARRAARAVPALPGHRAGPAPPPGRGGDRVRGGPRRARRSRQRPLGGAGLPHRERGWWGASAIRC